MHILKHGPLSNRALGADSHPVFRASGYAIDSSSLVTVGAYGRKYWLSSWCHCSRGGRHHTGVVRRPGDWLSSHRILGASGALLRLLIVSTKYLPVMYRHCTMSPGPGTLCIDLREYSLLKGTVLRSMAQSVELGTEPGGPGKRRT